MKRKSSLLEMFAGYRPGILLHAVVRCWQSHQPLCRKQGYRPDHRDTEESFVHWQLLSGSHWKEPSRITVNCRSSSCTNKIRTGPGRFFFMGWEGLPGPLPRCSGEYRSTGSLLHKTFPYGEQEVRLLIIARDVRPLLYGGIKPFRSNSSLPTSSMTSQSYSCSSASSKILLAFSKAEA